MGVLTLYTTYKEKGIFCVAIQKTGAGQCKWEASSNMKKFDDVYSMTLGLYEGKKYREASFSRSCGDFITENGVVCQDFIEEAVLKLHSSLISEKKDS
jgi:signal peptidase complex subunit 2